MRYNIRRKLPTFCCLASSKVFKENRWIFNKEEWKYDVNKDEKYIHVWGIKMSSERFYDNRISPYTTKHNKKSQQLHTHMHEYTITHFMFLIA